MSPFDPKDDGSLPLVVRRFVEARQRFDYLGAMHGAQANFRAASVELAREVRARGGRWEVGGIIYTVKEGSDAIGIEQKSAPALPASLDLIDTETA